MCGRFAATTDPARLAVEIDAVDETGGADGPNYGGPNYGGPNYGGPNYNVAPTTTIAAVVARHDDPGDAATRRIRLMRWGLLPSWVKAAPDGRPITKSLLINARAESLTRSPAFRAAAEHKRCLVPMDGYYEWMPNPDDPKKGRKTPYYMHRGDDRPLFMAGLWSLWKPGAAGQPMLSCTIVTTDAVGELARVHDRMPLLVAESDWDRWLDPDRPAPADLLTNPPDIGQVAIREVSTLVNRVANNGPELIEPVERGNQPVGLF